MWIKPYDFLINDPIVKLCTRTRAQELCRECTRCGRQVTLSALCSSASHASIYLALGG